MNLECYTIYNNGDPEGDRLIKQYLKDIYYPVDAPETLYIRWHGKLSVNIMPKKLTRQHKNMSLRDLAKEYCVSYESVRRVLKARSK